jgi:hypothetical protein
MRQTMTTLREDPSDVVGHRSYERSDVAVRPGFEDLAYESFVVRRVHVSLRHAGFFRRRPDFQHSTVVNWTRTTVRGW